MSPVHLHGELTIYQAAEIRPVLQQALAELNGDTCLALDLSGVTECDGAGLQLLIAFSHALEAAGSAVHLLHVSPSIMDMLSLYGLSERFAQPLEGTH